MLTAINAPCYVLYVVNYVWIWRDHDAVFCKFDDYNYCCHCTVYVVLIICICYIMFLILLHVSVFVTDVTEFFVCYLMEAHAAQRHIALAACKGA